MDQNVFIYCLELHSVNIECAIYYRKVEQVMDKVLLFKSYDIISLFLGAPIEL